MGRHRMTPDGPVPFTPEEEAAWDAEVAAYNAQEPARKAEEARRDRNRLLAETDWSQGKDVPDAVSSKYAAYRQALRDVPQQPGFPDSVQWPVKPE